MPRLGCLITMARHYSSVQTSKTIINNINTFTPCIMTSVRKMSSDPPEHHPESNEPWIPEYIEKFEEPLEEKRSRLMYQSRKRGMLENGLLLGKKFVLKIRAKLILQLFRKFCKEILARDGRGEAGVV